MTETRSRPNDWAAKHAAIDEAARAIIDQEVASRDAKTARLKALREAQETTVPAAVPAKRRVAKATAKPAKAKAKAR